MKVTIIFPALPPALDGIGDYTARLAATLASQAQVQILTAQPEADPVPGVDVRRAFSMDTRSGVWPLLAALRADPPDWVVLQFNQFSYGRWGLNLHLPLVVRRIKQHLPDTRIAWMAHEDFVPVTGWKSAVMTLWQRWQFWMLGRHADLLLFSIEPWAHTYQQWFPKKPVWHLPVGSNIERAGVTRRQARQRLGLADETFVLGVFGTLNASRMLSMIRQAAHALYRRTQDMVLLYVGPHGQIMRESLGSLPLLDAGRLPAPEVSMCLAAMDVHLAPFIDGVSTRRGSFIAGLQHEVASVGTVGALTDARLHQENGEAFLLAPTRHPEVFEELVLSLYEQPRRREALAAAGRAFHASVFEWDVIAARLMEALEAVDAGAPCGQEARLQVIDVPLERHEPEIYRSAI